MKTILAFSTLPLRGEAARSSIPAWLPVPATSSVIPTRKRTSDSSAKALQRIWVGAAAETSGEKITTWLLVFGSVIAIGYGFSCFLDLAQNWAGFNAGIERMIQ